MGYYVTVQKNPHDDVGPCYSEGDASNVVELQFDDDGVEAEALHELIGVVVGRGKSLDADAAAEYHDTIERLRSKLPKENDRMVDGDALADTDDAPGE